MERNSRVPSLRNPPRWLCEVFALALPQRDGRIDPGLWLMCAFNANLDVRRTENETLPSGRHGVVGTLENAMGRFVGFYPRHSR